MLLARWWVPWRASLLAHWQVCGIPQYPRHYRVHPPIIRGNVDHVLRVAPVVISLGKEVNDGSAVCAEVNVVRIFVGPNAAAQPAVRARVDGQRDGLGGCFRNGVWA